MYDKYLRRLENSIISIYWKYKYYFKETRALSRARHLYSCNYCIDEKEPLVSVYIPTYNRCELLMDRAVDSVLRQNYRNFELLIIGDHCTDNTEKIVSRIKDTRVSFFNIPNRGYRYPPTAENHWYAGPVVAANTALDMVKGKWIARLDDDDVWTYDHLEKLLSKAIADNLEFISGSYLVYRNGMHEVVNPKDLSPSIGGTQTWLYRSYLKLFRYNINSTSSFQREN